MIRNNSLGSRLFDGINQIFLIFVGLIAVLPFAHIIAGSFTTSEELLLKRLVLIPTKITFDAYKYIFSTDTLSRSLSVTIYITILGTFIQLLFTLLLAYPLAHKNFMGRSVILSGVIFTMLFGGGMIPTFLVVKGLGLLDSFWALMLPTAISTFNLIVLKNFFQTIPAEIEESAKIDGCNDLFILIRIVIPLSLPAIATFTLFYAVGHWNSFFNAVLYINDSKKWPVQVLLRQIVIMSQGGIGDQSQSEQSVRIPAETVKMATIVVSTMPILMVYPFLQKYFTKGVLLGSVKG